MSCNFQNCLSEMLLRCYRFEYSCGSLTEVLLLESAVEGWMCTLNKWFHLASMCWPAYI